jgi:hypothetical protein
VRNLRFFQHIVNKISNDEVIPLSLLWASHEARFDKKLDSYHKHAIEPLLYQITHGYSALYPYLGLHGEIKLKTNEIDPANHVGRGMLETAGISKEAARFGVSGIYHFKKYQKFENITQYQIVQSVSAERNFNTVSTRHADMESQVSTCWALRLSKSVPDTDADTTMTDIIPATSDDDNITDGSECYHVYVSLDNAVRARMKNEKVKGGQEFKIRFRHRQEQFATAGTECWKGPCITQSADKDFKIDDKKIDFVILAERRRFGPKITAYDHIEEAVRHNPLGTKISLRASPNMRPFSHILNALKRLEDGKWANFARILLGLNENAPRFAADQFRYPANSGKVIDKDGEEQDNPHARKEEEVDAYRKWSEDLETLNKNSNWGLDKDQLHALDLCTYQNLINLVQGPPGTGKTKTEAASVHIAVKAGEKVLVVAPSNTAVDEITDRLITMRPSDFKGAILREHVPSAEARYALKDKDSRKESTGTSAMESVHDITEMSNRLKGITTIDQTKDEIRSIRQQRPTHFVDNEHSTGEYIHRLVCKNYKVLGDRIRNGLVLDKTEQEHYDAAKTITDVSTTFATMDEGPQRKKAMGNFSKALRLYRTLAYNDARILVTTCANAGNQHLVENFHPTVIYVDEAAQGTEYEVVTAVLMFKQLRQINCFGDHLQLAPTTSIAALNEFSENADHSLFERLKDNGVYIYALGTQYRMTESCLKLVNKIFYKNSIKTADIMRQPNKINAAVINFNKKILFSKLKDNGNVRDVVLCHIPDSVGSQDPHSYSTINFAEANATADLIAKMLYHENDISSDDIGVISYYKGQLWVLRDEIPRRVNEYFEEKNVPHNQRPDTSRIRLFTTESSQGKEMPIVFLNLCKTGMDVNGAMDENSSLPKPEHAAITSYMTDASRANVACSRQKFGLYIIGNIKSLKYVFEKKMNPTALKRVIDICMEEGWYWKAKKGAYAEFNTPARG